MGFKEWLALIKDTLSSQENPVTVFVRKTEEFMHLCMISMIELFLAKIQHGQFDYKPTSEEGRLEDEEWQSLTLAWNFCRASQIRLNCYWKSTEGTYV